MVLIYDIYFFNMLSSVAWNCPKAPVLEKYQNNYEELFYLYSIATLRTNAQYLKICSKLTITWVF